MGGTAVAVVGGVARGRGHARARGVRRPARRDRAHAGPLRVQDTPDGAALTGWPSSRPSSPACWSSSPTRSRSRPTPSCTGCNEDLPDLRIIGGLASAAARPGGNRLVLDERVVDERRGGRVPRWRRRGADPRLAGLPADRPPVRRHESRAATSSGSWRASRRSSASRSWRPPRPRTSASCCARACTSASSSTSTRPSSTRGDFLVRNVLGADQHTGALAVGEQVSVGPDGAVPRPRRRPPPTRTSGSCSPARDADAALLFTCNGRGRHLFGVPDHDAGLVEQLLGPIPLAGAFCAGEIGPVGGRNFLHGFTASLALFA